MNSWLELEARFRNLVERDKDGNLALYRTSNGWRSESGAFTKLVPSVYSEIKGWKRTEAYYVFLHAALHLALNLDKAEEKDEELDFNKYPELIKDEPIHIWFHYLRLRSGVFVEEEGWADRAKEINEPPAEVLVGRIYDLLQESANVCLKLHFEEVVEKKQREENENKVGIGWWLVVFAFIVLGAVLVFLWR